MARKKSAAKADHFDPTELETNELTTSVKTTQDDYTEDPAQDPEGVEARSGTEHKEMFPFWVLDEFEVSPNNLWGREWPDGGEHLVPRQTTIDAVIHTHEAHSTDEGWATGMRKLALTHIASIKAHQENYESIFSEVSSETGEQFQIIRSVQNIVQALLAERAYKIYLFRKAAGSVRDQTKPLPDYVEKAQERMYLAATTAGVWYEVFMHLHQYAGYKNEPRFYVENDIRNRLVNVANYHDTNNRAAGVTANASEYLENFEINC